VRPEPQVHPIGRAQIGRLGDQPHRLLDDAVEELLVGAGLRSVHPAVGREDEHQVDVAGIVELGAAELAEGDDGEADPLPARSPRLAASLLDPG
jgi:hypothetical protein